MSSNASSIPVEMIAKPGPSLSEACDDCGGDPNPVGSDPHDDGCTWCRRYEEAMDSEEKAAFDAWAEAVREQLIADRVGGLCAPIDGGEPR